MGKSITAALSGDYRRSFALPFLALAVVVTGGPAVADTAAQLDASSQATDKSTAGIALARKQIKNDELLEAMATLERVMMNAPENLEARALHAGLLCRIDDRRGAVMEFDLLRGLEVPQAISAEARAPCESRG